MLTLGLWLVGGGIFALALQNFELAVLLLLGAGWVLS